MLPILPLAKLLQNCSSKGHYTRLDILRPSVESRVATQQQQHKTAHDRHASDRSFALGQTVLVKNWRGEPCWVKGVIVRVLGAVKYEVDVGESTTQLCHSLYWRERGNLVSSSSAASVPPTEEHPNEPLTHSTNQDNSSQPEQFTNSDVPELQTESQTEASTDSEGQTEPPPRKTYPQRNRVPQVPFDPSDC